MNVRPFIAALGFALAAACSPTPPGPQPGVTYFWLVTSSMVAFNDYCTDDMTFRDGNKALEIPANSYIIYKASDDGSKATQMKCTEVDASKCMPAMPGIVFDVAGGELSFETEVKTPIGSGPCNQLDSQAWILTDHVQTLDVQISHTLSLVDDVTTCNRIEMDAETHSGNHKGYQGCTVTFVLGTSSR